MNAAGIALVLVASAVPCIAADEFVPPPNKPGESAWIPLRHQRQEKNLCVPTSASIILEYFGDSITPREIKTLSRGKTYDPQKPFTDFTITVWSDLIGGLRRRGYDWRTESFDDDGPGFVAGWMEITHWLDRGVPVMVDTTIGKSPHTFVLAGYSTPQKAVFSVDPSLEAPGIRTIGFVKLSEIWTSRRVGTERRGLLIPHPRSRPSAASD